MTTFLPAAAATCGWAAIPPTASTAASIARAKNRTDRWRDALWAPSWATGNGLASSLPERRAWGAATVGVVPPTAGRRARGARRRGRPDDAWDGGRPAGGTDRGAG